MEKMLDDELKKIWWETPVEIQVKWEKAKFLLDLKKKTNNFRTKIFYRNLLEILAAVLVIIGFIYYFLISNDILMKGIFVFIIAWAIFVIYKLVSTQKKDVEPNISQNLKENMRAFKNYIQAEKQLLENVFYWYLLPFLLGITVYVLVLNLTNVTKLTSLAFIYLFSAIIFYYNKRYVLKHYDPLLRQVDFILKELEEDKT